MYSVMHTLTTPIQISSGPYKDIHIYIQIHTYIHTYDQFATIHIVIYKAFCFDVAQGRMNGAPNETQTHSYRFASLAC